MVIFYRNRKPPKPIKKEKFKMTEQAYNTRYLTVSEFQKLNNEKKLNVGMYYQRGHMVAWKKPERIDALIDSILASWHIQPLHAREDENGILELLDGKQRTNAIFTVLNGDYVPQLDELSVKGQTFPMWSQDEKDAFYNYPLEIIIHNLDDTDILKYFGYLQKGIPLTPIPLN